MEENINNLNIDDIDQINYDQEIIKSKDNKIRKLKRQIKAYESNAENQNLKLSDYDNLLVDYKVLSQNCSLLEKEVIMLRKENNNLKGIIKNKNNDIKDFKGLFQTSKSKFELFNQTNNSLKMKIVELESKLKTYPNLTKKNDELNIKIQEYEAKLKQINEEFSKTEEIHKIKLLNQEKFTQSANKEKDEEISILKNEVTRLKNNLDLLKRKNEEILDSKKLSEEQYSTKLIYKEKENQKLSKLIEELKQTISNSSLDKKNEISKQKHESQELKNKIKELSSNISQIDSENSNLIEALNQANTVVNQSKTEIEKRNNIIKGLKEENNQLEIQLQEKQNDFEDYQLSSQQEIEFLKQKLEEEQEDKDNIIAQLESQDNEINQFKEEIINYQNSGNIILNENKEKENELNNMEKLFQIKEEEYINEIDNLRIMNTKLNKDLQNMKNKYDKKIKELQLQYDGASLRVNKLIHNNISLKQQLLNLQRNLNINNINDVNSIINSGNNQKKFSSSQLNLRAYNDDLFNETL